MKDYTERIQEVLDLMEEEKHIKAYQKLSFLYTLHRLDLKDEKKK